MSKWNENPKYGRGWTFRTGRKHSYRLGPHGGIAMTLDPVLAGVYRFLPPVDGAYRISAELFVGDRTDVTLTVRLNGVLVATRDFAKGTEGRLDPVTVSAHRLDKLDFIIEGVDRVPAFAELLPHVDFVK